MIRNNSELRVSGQSIIGNNNKIIGNGNSICGNNNKIKGNGNSFAGNNNKCKGNNNSGNGNNNSCKGIGNNMVGMNCKENGKYTDSDDFQSDHVVTNVISTNGNVISNCDNIDVGQIMSSVFSPGVYASNRGSVAKGKNVTTVMSSGRYSCSTSLNGIKIEENDDEVKAYTKTPLIIVKDGKDPQGVPVNLSFRLMYASCNNVETWSDVKSNKYIRHKKDKKIVVINEKI
jgi:hypothetical protein